MSPNEKHSYLVTILESLTFGRVVAIIFLILFGFLVAAIWFEKLFIEKEMLDSISKIDFGRFLIMFLVVLVTVSIALILVISLFYGSDDHRKERFILGKDVLTIFVGILGTIMGFYYAEGTVQNIKDLNKEQPVTQTQTAATEFEKAGLEALLKMDYNSSLTALNKAYEILPTLHNVEEIRKILQENKIDFEAAEKAKNEPQKKEIWKKIYCQINDKKLTWGMSKEVLNQFKDKVNELGCVVKPNTNSNSNSNVNSVSNTNSNVNSNSTNPPANKPN